MIQQRALVLVSFPYSDLAAEKVRPAIVISNDRYNGSFGDVIAVPVTSNLAARDYTLDLTATDLESGKLITASKIKVDRVLSLEKQRISMVIGRVKRNVHQNIVAMLFSLIQE